MSTGVLLALSGEPEEQLVRGIGAVRDLTVTRRCADLEELLAAALAGLGAVAVTDTECDLDRGTVHRLGVAGVRVLVLCPGLEHSRYRSIGAEPVEPEADLLARVRELVARGPLDPEALSTQPPAVAGPVSSSLPATAAPPHQQYRDLDAAGRRHPGRVIAVTGPPGSPGRSSIAVNLTAELVRAGEQVLLADADIWSASLAQILGVIEESAGLAAAIRAGDRGMLSAASLADLTTPVAPGWQLLTGLSRAHRWREVSSPSLEVLWARAREVADWVVVDTPVLVPEDEESYPGGFGPSRNAVTHSVLEVAERVLVVGAAEPIGVERLVQTLLDLQDLVGPQRREVLVNRVRSSAAGPRPQDSVREALGRFAGVHDVVLVPDDRAVADKALLTGNTWAQVAPRSPARLAMQELTGRLGLSARPPRPSRWRLQRRTGKRPEQRAGVT